MVKYKVGQYLKLANSGVLGIYEIIEIRPTHYQIQTVYVSTQSYDPIFIASEPFSFVENPMYYTPISNKEANAIRILYGRR